MKINRKTVHNGIKTLDIAPGAHEHKSAGTLHDEPACGQCGNRALFQAEAFQ